MMLRTRLLGHETADATYKLLTGDRCSVVSLTQSAEVLRNVLVGVEAGAKRLGSCELQGSTTQETGPTRCDSFTKLGFMSVTIDGSG